MLEFVKNRVTKLSNQAIQNITGGTIGLTTALASVQRAGCNGNCRSCQSCTVAGLMLIMAPFIVKFQGRIQKLIFVLTLIVLGGVSWFIWHKFQIQFN